MSSNVCQILFSSDRNQPKIPPPETGPEIN